MKWKTAIRAFARRLSSERMRVRLASPFLRNLSWMGASQIAIRISRLLTTIVLTRLLSPNDYGSAAIVLTMYEFVALFTRNGISAKVVQARPDEVAVVAQTAYCLTWAVCIALMVVQLALAIPIARIFNDPQLALPIALMSLVFLATPVSNIQCAFLQREGRVGRFALASTLQVAADNVLTAIFAMLGLGMWAIVLPKLLVAPIWALMIRHGHSWRAEWHWSLTGWREIARFSRHVIGVELMTTMQANVDNLLVGYFLGVEALGVYYFAFNAGLGIALGLINGFGIAVYPHLCEVRSDGVKLAARFRESLRSLGILVVPMVLLQVALAPIYVPIVFGPKWTPAIPVLMVICLSAVARPFATATSQLLKAVGHPEIELRWQIVLTVLLVIGLVAGAQIDILAVAIAVLTVQTSVLTAFCLIAPRPFVGPLAVHSRASCIGLKS
jgi:PST family polysaccharide transporter